jgi:hypothetical protein
VRECGIELLGLRDYEEQLELCLIAIRGGQHTGLVLAADGRIERDYVFVVA